MHHNSAEYWEKRWQDGQTGWDLGTVNPVLAAELQHPNLLHPTQPDQHILVPGCGSGYEVEMLAKAGWYVTAVDIASEPLRRLEDRLSLEASDIQQRVRVMQEDILSFPKVFDNAFHAVWEYTCYCALPPAFRDVYAQTIKRVVKPGGNVFFLFFPIGTLSQEGPPFAVEEQRDIQRFTHLGFSTSLQSHQSSHPARAKREKFLILQKQ